MRFHFPLTRLKRIEGKSVEVPIPYICTFCKGTVPGHHVSNYRDVEETTREQYNASQPCSAAKAEIAAA